MSAGDEFMMPIERRDALGLAEIHAMRQVADSIKMLADQVSSQGQASAEQAAATTRAMERLADKVDGMNTRLVRLEEAKHGREIDRLDHAFASVIKRVDDLERTRDQQRGAKTLVDWIRQTAPWILAIVGASAGVIGIKSGSAL